MSRFGLLTKSKQFTNQECWGVSLCLLSRSAILSLYQSLVHSQYNVIMIVYIGEDSISW